MLLGTRPILSKVVPRPSDYQTMALLALSRMQGRPTMGRPRLLPDFVVPAHGCHTSPAVRAPNHGLPAFFSGCMGIRPRQSQAPSPAERVPALAYSRLLLLLLVPAPSESKILSLIASTPDHGSFQAPFCRWVPAHGLSTIVQRLIGYQTMALPRLFPG